MDYNFDKKIKEVLEGLDQPLNSEHWTQMDEILSASDWANEDAPLDRDFDAGIANKIFDITTGESADWDAFSEKLEQEESEGNLDAIIAASLTAATASTAADWDAFSDMLSTAEAQDLDADENIVDKTTRSNLQNLETSYQPENWSLMQERINEEFSFRRKLMRWRAAEISLMILAILTLFNFLPKNEAGQLIIIEEVKERIIPKLKVGKPLADKMEQSAYTGIEKNKQETAALSTSAIDETAFFETDGAELLPASKGTTLADSFEKLEPIQGRDLVLQTQSDLDLKPTVIEEKEKKDKGLFVWRKKKNEAENIEEAIQNIAEPLVLSILSESSSREVVSEEKQILKANTVVRDYKNVRLGMFSAASLFGVYSPYDRFFNYRPDVVYDANIGTGLLIDFQRNRWHLVTGGAYTPKYFQPAIGDEVVGSFETAYVKEDLEQVRLEILHLPLELRFDMIQKPKWRLYSAAGASFNFVLNTGYKKSEIILARDEDADYRSIQASSRMNSNLARKDFTKGIAEGGALPENTFLTVQFGLGVERFVTQRWSIFFEPIYQQQFSKTGIGPNDNSFRSLSFRLGAKATMFGK